MIGAFVADATAGGVWPFTQATVATVANGPSSEVSQSGCSFTVEGERAQISAEALTACMSGTGTTTLTDEVPESSIKIASPVAGSKTSSLELKTNGSISQSAPIKTGNLKLDAKTGVKLTREDNSVSSLEVENTESGDVEFVNEAALMLGKTKAAEDAKVEALKLEEEVGAKIEARNLALVAKTGVKATSAENAVSSLEVENTESGDVEFVNEAALMLGKTKAAEDAKVEALKLDEEVGAKIEARNLALVAKTGVKATSAENAVSSLEVENTESGDVEFVNEAALMLGNTKAAEDAKVEALKLDEEVGAKIEARNLALVAKTGVKATSAENAVSSLEVENTESGDVEFVNEAALMLGKTKAAEDAKVEALKLEEEVGAKIEARNLALVAKTGVKATSAENSVSSLEVENTESGNVDFVNEQSLALGKIRTQPLSETVITAKQLTQPKTATIEAGKLELSSANGIKLTGPGNSAESLEASDTTSGNVEVTAKHSLGLGIVSTPGKGKVSIKLTDPEAEGDRHRSGVGRQGHSGGRSDEPCGRPRDVQVHDAGAGQHRPAGQPRHCSGERAEPLESRHGRGHRAEAARRRSECRPDHGV